MSSHPYVAAHDQRTGPPTRCTSTSAIYNSTDVTISNLAHVSENRAHGLRLPDTRGQISDAVKSDGQVLPTSAQINQEIYEAEAARNQGLISTAQYLKVLCGGLTKGSALLNRELEGLRRAMRGEDSREAIIRDAGFTDAESEAWFQEIENIWNAGMVNGQRGKARKFHRAITRGQ
ncbi:hypothetical protein DENSPDRAFT_842117 [Dentipellis sp. KUC8613]|nr:hypothetical protein DENSPDRAFT_842117 [Dentipellis sp. KUC8613]